MKPVDHKHMKLDDAVMVALAALHQEGISEVAVYNTAESGEGYFYCKFDAEDLKKSGFTVEAVKRIQLEKPNEKQD